MTAPKAKRRRSARGILTWYLLPESLTSKQGTVRGPGRRAGDLLAEVAGSPLAGEDLYMLRLGAAPWLAELVEGDRPRRPSPLEGERRDDCVHYGACLAEAARADWPGLSCPGSCSAYLGAAAALRRLWASPAFGAPASDEAEGREVAR